MVSDEDLKTLYKNLESPMSLLIISKIQRSIGVKIGEVKKIINICKDQHHSEEDFIAGVRSRLELKTE